jgi:hypothetical protein
VLTKVIVAGWNTAAGAGGKEDKTLPLDEAKKNLEETTLVNVQVRPHPRP